MTACFVTLAVLFMNFTRVNWHSSQRDWSDGSHETFRLAAVCYNVFLRIAGRIITNQIKAAAPAKITHYTTYKYIGD